MDAKCVTGRFRSEPDDSFEVFVKLHVSPQGDAFVGFSLQMIHPDDGPTGPSFDFAGFAGGEPARLLADALCRAAAFAEDKIKAVQQA